MTDFKPSDFKAGDWVEVVVTCDGLEKLGLKKGDIAQVDYVTKSFIHLLPRSTVGGFFAWRFAPAPAPAPKLQPTAPEKPDAVFRAGDLVKILKEDPFLLERGFNIGDIVRVEEVLGDSLRLKTAVGVLWCPVKWFELNSHSIYTPPEGSKHAVHDLQAQSTTPEKPDAVFRPNHYTRLWPEPITVINAWKLGFNLGNAVKYIARAGHKNSLEEDLKKAIRYLKIELECVRRNKAVADGADKATLIETL